MQDTKDKDHPDFRIGVSWKRTKRRINANMIGTYHDRNRKRTNSEIKQLTELTKIKHEIQKELQRIASKRNQYPPLSKTYRNLINAIQTNDEKQLLKDYANHEQDTQQYTSVNDDIVKAPSTDIGSNGNKSIIARISENSCEQEIINTDDGNAITSGTAILQNPQRISVQKGNDAATTIQKTSVNDVVKNPSTDIATNDNKTLIDTDESMQNEQEFSKGKSITARIFGNSSKQEMTVADGDNVRNSSSTMVQNPQQISVEKENDAAITIQKNWKGHKVRQQFNNETEAAVTIQKAWREHNDTQQLKNTEINQGTISEDEVRKSLAELSMKVDVKDQQIELLQNQIKELSTRISRQQNPISLTGDQNEIVEQNKSKEVSSSQKVVAIVDEKQTRSENKIEFKQDPVFSTQHNKSDQVKSTAKINDQVNKSSAKREVLITHDNDNQRMIEQEKEQKEITSNQDESIKQHEEILPTSKSVTAPSLSFSGSIQSDQAILTANINDTLSNSMSESSLDTDIKKKDVSSQIAVIDEDQKTKPEVTSPNSTQLTKSDQVDATTNINDELRNSLTELSLAVEIKNKKIESLEQQNQRLVTEMQKQRNSTTLAIAHTTDDQESEEVKLDIINLDDTTDNLDTDKEDTDTATDSETDTESESNDESGSIVDTEEESEEEGFFGYITSFFTPASNDENPFEITEEKLQNVFKQIDYDKSDLIDWNEFQQCAQLLFLTNEDMDLKKAFKQADTDRTGYLNYAEFRCAILGQDAKKLSVNKLKLMFDRFDKDNSGVLELEEFTTACEKLKFGTLTNDNMDDIPKYFEKVDTDNSGFIDFREFVQAILGRELTGKEMRNAHEYAATIKRIKQTFKEMDSDGSGKLNMNEFVTGARKLNLDASEPKLKKLFKKHDINKDGSIEPVEFVSLMYRMSVKSEEG